MTTDDLARTIAMGVLGTLVAFESVAASLAWLANRSSGKRFSVPVLWLSRPGTIRAHLSARRHEFDLVRWQYPILRSAGHAREIRLAIRRTRGHGWTAVRLRRSRMALLPAVDQPATRPLP